jgi:predicted AAA+ superfamily ATPase
LRVRELQTLIGDEMNGYLSRVIDARVKEYLEVFGAVILEGARATGKTTTGKHLAASSVSLDASPQLAALAQTDPSTIFAGKSPRLIDEWQLAPNVWNAIRHEVDERRTLGQFILTGSATPRDELTLHSGGGRFGRIRLRTMSLYELGASSGAVSLNTLLRDNPPVGAVGGPDVRAYTTLIVKGGWPAVVDLDEAKARIYLEGYLEGIIRVDIGGRTDAERMRVLIRSLARNLSTEVALKNLAREARIFPDDASEQGAEPTISEVTTRKYLDSLARIFVLEELSAWPTHIVSRVRQRVSPKWHFVDPSLAAAALGLSTDSLLAEPLVLGFFFESLAIRDLRIYAGLRGGSVMYYRDETGLEVDAIVEMIDGRWAAFEIKLGGDAQIDEGAASLRKLYGKLSEGKRRDMASLNILTAGPLSYTRSDGVNVIALGHLAP